MSTPHISEHRRALIERVRVLMGTAMLTDVDESDLDRANSLISEAIAVIDRSTRSGRYTDGASLAPRSPNNDSAWETHCAFGRANPVAPPLVDVVESEQGVSAHVLFGPSYEGGPGNVYGGAVASAFDGALGRAVLAAGFVAVTRSLGVTYRRPTPLGVLLDITTAVQSVDGRNIEVAGQLTLDGNVLCEGRATFTAVEDSRYNSATR
jgi:acyl-coenzyme A thioesterase PaaI-like protein